MPEQTPRPEISFDPVLAHLGRLVTGQGGFDGPKIEPAAEAMAGELTEDQLAWVEARSRQAAAAENRSLDAGWYSDAGSPYRRAASAALAVGDTTEATRQLAMAKTFDRLGRREHEKARAAAIRSRSATRQ